MIQHFKDIHWDLRPHPDFGTLELRVMDAASDHRTIHGLSAFARSMMVQLAVAGDEDICDVLPQDLPHWIEKENRYRASKQGLEADYIIDDKGNFRPLRDLVSDLVEFCAPIALQYDESDGLEIARDLLTGVPAYKRQLDAYRANNSARSVAELLERDLLDGTN
jgi:carboxylate-amine ligase